MAPLHKAVAQGTDLLIQHFTHQEHPLRQVYMAVEFNCDGCNTLGFGTRYHCSSCDFDLHEHCAKSPFSLSSPLHPSHQLNLVNVAGKQHFCDVCGKTANGIFYTCQACDFDVHPLCTQIALTVQHAPHPHHLLTLQPGNGNSACCCVCGGACVAWRYRCGACNVDVHQDCVKALAVWVPPPAQAAQYGGYAPGVPSSGVSGQMPAMWVPQPTPVSHCGGNAAGVPSSGYGMNYPSVYQEQANGNGREKSNIYSTVGKFAVNALCTSLIGVPLNFSSKK